MATTPRKVITNYGAHLSPRSRDARLEATINGSMDYLANEGLTVMGLFKEKAPHADVHKAMVTIMSGKDLDFVALNDAPLATTVLEECLIRVSEAVFPWKLVEPLAEALRQSKGVPPQQKHLAMQQLLLNAVRSNAVSPIFLNLLGLLNLIVQHGRDNGCTLQVAADAFAPRMLENFGAGLQADSREWRYSVSKAASVLAELIDKVYVMFPPQNEGAPDEAEAEAAWPAEPSSSAAVPGPRGEGGAQAGAGGDEDVPCPRRPPIRHRVHRQCYLL